mgnify:CR=1 FL=1
MKSAWRLTLALMIALTLAACQTTKEEPAPEPEPEPEDAGPSRTEVLAMIDTGELDVEEAIRMLGGEPAGEEMVDEASRWPAWSAPRRDRGHARRMRRRRGRRMTTRRKQDLPRSENYSR